MIDRSQDGFSVEIHEVSQGFLQKSYLESSDLGHAIYYALVAVRSQPIELLANTVRLCECKEVPEHIPGINDEWLEVCKAIKEFSCAAEVLTDAFDLYRTSLLERRKGDVCNANE